MGQETGATREQRTPRSHLPWLTAALILVLLPLRTPDALLAPAFWAEDGLIFFQQWRDLGLASFITPYAGYLHLAPRLVAMIAGLLPLEVTVLVYFGASVLLTAWTGCFIARTIGGWAGVASGLCILLAFGSAEVLSTPTNVQWVLAIGFTVWASSPIPAVQDGSWPRRVFVVLAAFTGPFSIFAGPVLAIRLVVAARRSAWSEAALALAALAAGPLQAALILQGDRADSAVPENILSSAADLVFQSMGNHPLAVIFCSLALLAAFLAGRFRWFYAGSTAASGVLIIASAVANSSDPGIFTGGLAGQRYWYVPSALLIICLLVMLAKEPLWPLRGLAAVALVSLLLVSRPTAFQRWDRPAFENWQDAVARYRNTGKSHYRFPPGWELDIEPPAARP